MRILAFIPARSGSKGLKDKNIKEMCGKPLVAHTIQAAIDSGIFDCVHVSTDSEHYADISKSYGADVPFLRTPELSDDQASSWDAVKFTLEQYKKRGIEFDMVGLLQPTSPLRTGDDIKGAYQFFLEKNANAVISVCETDHSPLWSDTLPIDCNMNGFVDKKYREIPRQNMPVYYRVNGAIYLFKKECLSDIDALYDHGCYGYIMSREQSIDIDQRMDFVVAEAIMREKVNAKRIDE